MMARLALASIKLGGQEAARVPFDTVVEASAFGSGVEMGTSVNQPYVSRHPLTTSEQVNRIAVPDPLTDGRAPVVLEAIRLLRGEDVPVLGAVTAPFSLACFLRGERESLMDTIIDPSFLQEVMGRAEQFTIAFIDEMVGAGADVIVIEDTWASGEILSPRQYVDFALPGEKALIQKVRSLGARSILHQCGHPRVNLPLMVESRAHGITIHHQIGMAEARNALTNRCAAVGNLDPRALASLQPEEIASMARKCVDDGFEVLAPSCGRDPHTPLKNLQAMASIF
jgi:[methyl-Co(III) methanol-specific corrinoid protein]:coenzyme M methyltransferase